MINLIKGKCEKLKSKIKQNKIKYLIILFVIILLILMIILEGKKFRIFFHLKNIIFFIFVKLEKLYKHKTILAIFLLYLIQIVVIVFSLPIHFLITILIYFIIKNNKIYYLIIFTGSNLSSLIIFLITNKLCKNFVKKKLSKYDIIKKIKEKVNEKPFLYSFLCKFLFIPLGLKEYSLSIVFKLKEFMLGSILYYSYETLQYLLISIEIDSFKNFLFHKTKKKNLLRHMLSIIFLIISFSISLITGIWLKNNIVIGKKINKINNIEI